MEIPELRLAAAFQPCIRCGKKDGVVLAHYTGVRRLDLAGGYGLKVHDLMGAHLCGACHLWMDTRSRDKERKWEHSEEFLFLVAQTILRLWDQERIGLRSSENPL
jgi:hypothetical protein